MTAALRFIGHTGELRNLRRVPARSIFAFDANTIMTFMQHLGQQERVPEAYYGLLLETRARVRQQWTERQTFIPIDPVLGILELTKQDLEPDFPAYLKRFRAFFTTVYGIDDYDPAWVHWAYEPMLHHIQTTHRSTQRTIEEILALAPATGSLKRTEILARIDAFLAWTLANLDDLAMVGGPLLQLAVHAIAGDPKAHRFLKLGAVARDGAEAVARNVTWDLMQWINLEMNYHFNKYKNTIVCTADQALADLLLQRRHLGPRVGSAYMDNNRAIPAYGESHFPSLTKVEGTHLEREIFERLVHFLGQVNEQATDNLTFGQFPSPASP